MNKFLLMNYLVGGNKDAQHNRAWRYGKVSATFGAHSSLVLHQVSWHFCDRHPCTDWIPFRHQRASSRRCFGLCSRSDSEVRRTSSINHRKTFRSLSFYQVSLNNFISFLLAAILHKIYFFFFFSKIRQGAPCSNLDLGRIRHFGWWHSFSYV